jgi:hypothetical protein
MKIDGTVTREEQIEFMKSIGAIAEPSPILFGAVASIDSVALSGQTIADDTFLAMKRELRTSGLG